MGYASISGRAITNPDAPRAFGVCDRCGLWYNHKDLRWQFDYRGRMLQNIRILVCETCEDEAQPQLKPRILPPDPIPILNARVESFCSDEVDDRTTTNPALPPVDFASTTNIQLSGLQFIDGVQLQEGELVLVMGQTDYSKNGIYKASTGVWTLQGFDNDTHVYVPAASIDTSWSGGVLYYSQLGTYMGAVYVARGRLSTQLFQIFYADPNEAVSVGTTVSIQQVAPFSVNRIDFFTGIYMAGQDVRVTQDDYVRTPQQTGAASGSLNEVPGFSNLVPGSCDIGIPDAVPYGCATHQGLPPSMDTLPYSGSLWPTLQDQSIDVWLKYDLTPAVWVTPVGTELTFTASGFWPSPGPGAPFRPLSFKTNIHPWVNNNTNPNPWDNVTNVNIPWTTGALAGVFGPGGNTLWKNDKCQIVLAHNIDDQNVNFSQIYPNAVSPDDGWAQSLYGW